MQPSGQYCAVLAVGVCRLHGGPTGWQVGGWLDGNVGAVRLNAVMVYMLGGMDGSDDVIEI